MKAIYKFEEELLKEYDFEPMNEGYNIDDLKENDREQLSGMLWLFYDAIRNWKNNENFENGENGLIGQIQNECFEKQYERLERDILSSIENFVISTLEGYEE